MLIIIINFRCSGLLPRQRDLVPRGGRVLALLQGDGHLQSVQRHPPVGGAAAEPRPPHAHRAGWPPGGPQGRPGHLGQPRQDWPVSSVSGPSEVILTANRGRVLRGNIRQGGLQRSRGHLPISCQDFSGTNPRTESNKHFHTFKLFGENNRVTRDVLGSISVSSSTSSFSRKIFVIIIIIELNKVVNISTDAKISK